MAIALIRTVILYILTILALRCMGRRQIGELEPAELVVTLLISDLATLCMQDLDLPLLFGLIPMATLVILEIVFSHLTLKIPFARRLLGGRYSVLVEDGRIDQREMRRAQMTLGELMEELRQNGLTAVEDVKYCVLENDGKISVIPKKGETCDVLPLILVSDGVPVRENLRRRGISGRRLLELLARYGHRSPSTVFLFCETDGRYVCIAKEDR